MKKLILLLTLLITTLTINAQEFQISPDWTATDINGVEWNLYSILDEGKSVVLEFSYTTCGPCWTFHNSGTLKDVYEAYGPDGTDELMVFFIESVEQTGLADLQGETENTQGNWVEGTPFPIIDNHLVSDLYQFPLYPSVAYICPDRKTYIMPTLVSYEAYEPTENCLPSGGNINATFLDYLGDEGSTCHAQNTTPSVLLQNLADVNMTSATLELSINGNVEQVKQWDGNLAQYEYEEVVFDELTIVGSNDLVFTITAINGTSAQDLTNNTISTSLIGAVQTTSDLITVKIETDDVGIETYWQVTDEDDNVLAYGGNENVGADLGQFPLLGNGPGTYEPFTTYTEDIQIPGNGCYRFLITDGFGDGIALGGGSYTIIGEDNEILATGGDFEYFESIYFQVEAPTYTNEISTITDMDIAPNPASNTITVNFQLEQTIDLDISIYNTFGKEITTLKHNDLVAGKSTVNIDIDNYPNGVYYLVMTSNNQQLSKKFVVTK